MPDFLANEFHPLRLTRFDFDVADFLSSPDVASMSAREVGQYVLLLCAAWAAGKGATLPNDPKILAKLARAPRGVSPKVMAKFCLTKTTDGVFVRHNTRLSREWKFALDRAQRRSEKAQNAAKIRWKDDAQSMPDACGEQCAKHSSSNAQTMLGNASVPVPVREEKSKPLRAQEISSAFTEEDDAARFAQFAEAYPPQRRPTGPEWEDARKIWKRLSVHDQLDAIKSLTGWKEFWGEDKPRYILAMVKFLRLKRWQGQPPLRKEKSDGKRTQPGSDSTQDHIDRLRRNAKVLGLDNP